MKTWRLIENGSADGITNMAVDRTLFESFVPGKPVFRLYQWQPAAITIGRFQDRYDLILENCEEDGIAVIKRMTGGGAILHHNELTYSLVCEQNDIGSFSVKDSYRILCDFLLETYRVLGLDAAFALTHPRPTLGEKSAVCFAGTEKYDIEINGKKIGGNAQLRHRKIIFQHGSIPLDSDLSIYGRYFKELPVSLENRATTLSKEGVNIDIAELVHIVKTAFAKSMKIVFR